MITNLIVKLEFGYTLIGAHNTLTTSMPPFWIHEVRYEISSRDKEHRGLALLVKNLKVKHMTLTIGFTSFALCIWVFKPETKEVKL